MYKDVLMTSISALFIIAQNRSYLNAQQEEIGQTHFRIATPWYSRNDFWKTIS